jgi:hypothetical protein
VKRITGLASGSLKASGLLLALAALLFVLQPNWSVVIRFQLDPTLKTVSGYVLLALMTFMWAPVWLRKYLSQPQRLEILKLVHQWMGALVLLVFLVHANLARSGYLAIFTLVVLLIAGVGTLLGWMQVTARASSRRWLMAAHIAMSFVVTGFSILHVYFVYAYAG